MMPKDDIAMVTNVNSDQAHECRRSALRANGPRRKYQDEAAIRPPGRFPAGKDGPLEDLVGADHCQVPSTRRRPR